MSEPYGKHVRRSREGGNGRFPQPDGRRDLAYRQQAGRRAPDYRQSTGSRKPGKQKKPWDLRSKILLIIGILLLATAGSIGAYVAHGYLDARAKYNTINDASGADSSLFADILAGNKSLFDIDMDWDALHEINPDIVGWVWIEGTKVSYPVVQGDDNDYYLNHNVDGSVSNSGAIFLDAENDPDFRSDNNILYGHNMLDGSMFAGIIDFKEQDFLEKNYHVIIVTPESAYLLSPAFTYVCSGKDDLRHIDFASEDALHDYIDKLMERAVTESLVDVAKIDKLFSFVTCSYEADDVRTVLCCVQRDAVSF